jgi:polysaccharide pyruvyl transferase WcaK-like protein
MKVGILTFNWAINYGAILQMFGLYKYLKDNNYDVYIINYSPDGLESSYTLKIFEKPIKPKRVVRRLLENIYKRKQYDKFYKFISQYMVLTKKIKNREELKHTIDKFDIVIVGSDQVWNYDITKEYLQDYLLTDIDCNKISYAASLGKNEIKYEVKPLFEKSLRDFDFVSVREESSIDYLKSICYREDYISCIDPVFLLSKDEWIKLSNESQYQIKDEEYILIYMLEYNEKLIKSANELSTKYNLPIYSIEIPFLRFKAKMPNIKKLHDVGPLDFVKLINNATFVLTNSFHGTAFSLILNKKFASFAHSTANLRMENLLNLYNLNDCQITHNSTIDFVEDAFRKCEKSYSDKNNRINEVIVSSKKYLINSIEDIGKRSR